MTLAITIALWAVIVAAVVVGLLWAAATGGLLWLTRDTKQESPENEEEL